MRRYFNTEGQCDPKEHYMVPLDDRLDQIKRLYVDRGKYFIINRARQYGKTTTLMALTEYLKDEYAVFPLDFQRMDTECFVSGPVFIKKFVRQIEKVFEWKKDLAQNIDERALAELSALKEEENLDMDMLFDALSKICETSKKPVVMIIDEVDSASNNQVFINFLSVCRGRYINRKNNAALHSVIFAGVYDVKNLKLKIRPEEEHRYNSPWNIAADFDVDMDFLPAQIAMMLEEYERDNQTGMDIEAIAEEIYQYTSGYPYLVSAICKCLDEKLSSIWTKKGIGEAVKIILNENSSLFDSMIKQLDKYRDLRDAIEQILYQGKRIPFSPDAKSIDMGIMFGYLKEHDGQIVMANRIFEMRLLNKFITEEALKSDAFRRGERDKNQFIRDKKLDMEQVLEKFVEYFHDVYGENDEKFVESHGRKIFLLYLKPIINGVGNYYLEAQTRDARRTDVIVDYLGEQFIIEMKIWHGNEYNERGERQLSEYLDYYRQKKGFMLSFNFNRKKDIGMREIKLGDKTIVEAVV